MGSEVFTIVSQGVSYCCIRRRIWCNRSCARGKKGKQLKIEPYTINKKPMKMRGIQACPWI